ncbi:unnamed protein product [[Candida] boidinii]|uniref:Unnamed protein product n=1 Tax=Candida boidinii TaxID=5477 RepID=A0ACB5TJ02_CANBO|nr:unnamed protein product [[Candida] boidinii]GME89940.1 unnamed protein product [[Candida] boidinii]
MGNAKQNYYIPLILKVGARTIEAGLAGQPESKVKINTNSEILNLKIHNTNSFDKSSRYSIASNSVNEADIKQLRCSSNFESVQDVYQRDCFSYQWLYSLDSLYYNNNSSIPLNSFEYNVKKILYRIIYEVIENQLGIEPRYTKIILVKNDLFPTNINKILNDLLIMDFKVNSVTFLQESICNCIASGIKTAIVIDIGWEMTVITPIFDLRVLQSFIKTTKRASSDVHYKIIENLQQQNNGENTNLSTEFNNIENLIKKRGTGNIKVDEIVEEVIVPKKSDIYDDDIDEKTIVELVSKLIQELPIDLRAPLSNNIITTGGLAKYPGLKLKLIHKINSVCKLKGNLLNTLGSWTGASIYTNSILLKDSNIEIQSTVSENY